MGAPCHKRTHSLERFSAAERIVDIAHTRQECILKARYRNGSCCIEQGTSILWYRDAAVSTEIHARRPLQDDRLALVKQSDFYAYCRLAESFLVVRTK